MFLIPGFVLAGAGILAMGVIGLRSIEVGGINLDIHTLSYAGAAIVLGVQMILFSVLTKLIGMRHGWLPEKPRTRWLLSAVTLERGLVVALILFLAGVALSLQAVRLWMSLDFGVLDPREAMRWVIPSVTLMAVGGQLALSVFVLEALRLPIATRK